LVKAEEKAEAKNGLTRLVNMLSPKFMRYNSGTSKPGEGKGKAFTMFGGFFNNSSRQAKVENDVEMMERSRTFNAISPTE